VKSRQDSRDPLRERKSQDASSEGVVREIGAAPGRGLRQKEAEKECVRRQDDGPGLVKEEGQVGGGGWEQRKTINRVKKLARR